jgi:hypothetical protein
MDPESVMFSAGEEDTQEVFDVGSQQDQKW